MVKRVGQKKRGNPSRKTKKIILMGTEGSNQTERKYFSSFNQLQNEYRILFSKGNNTDPVGVVNDLLKGAKKEELDLKHSDALACFIDVDFKSGREKELKEAIKLAKKKNVDLYLSNPCFEIWYLLHFRYSTKSYCSNDEVIKELSAYIQDYSKSKDVFELIIGKLETAFKNAKKLEDYHFENGTLDAIKKIPSTEVYKIVDKIIQNKSD